VLATVGVTAVSTGSPPRAILVSGSM
jgi:hypothetical protein